MQPVPSVAAASGSKSSRLRTWLGRPWLPTMVAVSGFCAAYLFGVFASWGNAGERTLYANLGMLAPGLAATLLAWVAAARQQSARSRWAWRLISLSFASFFAGDLAFFVYQNVLGKTPFPTVADLGYLVYYPLIFAGLMLIPGGPRDPWRRIGFELDALVVFLSGAMVVAYFFLIPTIASGWDTSLGYLLSVGYPVGDLLLLAGVAHSSAPEYPAPASDSCC
jgi:hypothetical protein